MKDTEFYQHLLGFRAPWFVRRVELDAQAGVDVYIEHASGRALPVLKGELRAVYDHTAERVWQHLDTCQYPTFLHVRLPRVSCPADGIQPGFGALGGGEFSLHPALRGARDRRSSGLRCPSGGGSGGADLGSGVGGHRAGGQPGLSRKPHRLPSRIGVDEKSLAKRHRYETLVYDLDRGRWSM